MSYMVDKLSGPVAIKRFVLNRTEHEIYPAHIMLHLRVLKH